LRERQLVAEDLQEYCAALIATATYNVYRAKYAKSLTPEDLMVRRRLHPHAEPKVRYATPADVFPSSRPSGTPDTVIEKFDIFAKQMRERGATTRG